jgi:hypothetical protein
LDSTVAANPTVLGRRMVSSQRYTLHHDAWIQTFEIGTLYRSTDIDIDIYFLLSVRTSAN